LVVDHVKKIKIGEDGDGNNIGTVELKSEGLYFMWWTNVITDEISAFDSIQYSMWVSMLNVAIANNLQVEIITEDDDSSTVLTIKLYSA